MRKNISLNEFEYIIKVISLLRKIGVLGTIDYVVTWEQKPKLIVNPWGNFEFENPQETYGCILSFWDEEGKVISTRRFKIKEEK
jgi:hypothetical protein